MKKTAILWGLCSTLLLAACHFESFDERCRRESAEYTKKQCPRRMDPYTMLDSLSYDMKSRTLTYYYTLEGTLDDDKVLTEEVYDGFRKELCKNIINSVELKNYKEKLINLRYCYYSKSKGNIRFKTTFTPEDYGAGTAAGTE